MGRQRQQQWQWEFEITCSGEDLQCRLTVGPITEALDALRNKPKENCGNPILIEMNKKDKKGRSLILFRN